MCRKAKKCDQLGKDPSLWSRTCPLPPWAWFDEQLDIFEEALRAFVGGDEEFCLRLLSRIRSEEMRDWCIEHGQMSGMHRANQLRLRDEPQTGSFAEVVLDG